MPANELEWGFYVVDEDRSWAWSNHVYTLGCVCLGYGETPEAAWAEAIEAGRVPSGFDSADPPTVAIRTADERAIDI